MNFKDALIKCLSSSNEVSYGRAMSAIAFIACILWDTFFVGFAAHKLGNFEHMVISDILPTSERLMGQAYFCGACYGVTKIGDIITAFRKPNV